MTTQPLFLKNTRAPYSKVSVAPVVLFTVLDHYLRRPENAERVIGTLLGTFDELTNSVEVYHCFPVPHTEKDSIAVDVEIMRSMADLLKRLHPKYEIVGWYSSGSEVTGASVLLHDFYGMQMSKSPIHMLIPALPSTVKPAAQAYYNDPLTMLDDKSEQIQAQFYPLPTVVTQELGELNLPLLHSNDESAKLGDNAMSLMGSIEQLQGLVDKISTYVDSVVEGKTEGSPEIGRKIHHALGKLPTSDPAFEKLFTSGIHDSVMVMYLASLTRSNIALADILGLQLPSESKSD